MTRAAFLGALRSSLQQSLSAEDINKATNFYSECISDRMEDGLSEEEAVAAMGTPEEAAKSVLYDTPLPKLVKARVAERKSGAGTAITVILLIVFFPVWLPLLIALIAVVFSVYAALAAVIISVVVAVIAVIAGGMFALGVALIYMFAASPWLGICGVGAAFAVIGAGLLLIIPIKYLIKGIVALFGLIGRGIKSLFVGKGR